MMNFRKRDGISRKILASISALVITIGLLGFNLPNSAFAAISNSTADASVSNTASYSTDVIYQIVTDRFSDGNSSNNPKGEIYDKGNPKKYHGGDWAGITQKLNSNYFTNLGVTALWISSPVENISAIDPSSNSASYHGYWAKDFFKTNPYFGSVADFKTLVDTAHSKNIKMIIDFVPNHTSTAEYSSMVFPEDGRLYRNGTLISGFKTDTQGIFNHESWTDFSTYENSIYHSLYGLADLNQQNSTVDGYLKDAINQWLDYGVDGIRVDAAKHMSEGWQKNWLSSVYTHKPVFVFGEWFNGGITSDSQMNHFANNSGMSLLDFRFANAVRNALGNGMGTMTDLNSVISSTSTDYNKVNDQVTFIDNHDMSRFNTLAGNNRRSVDNAYVVLLTSRGIPTIYYGSEQYAQGESDPDNRGDMPAFDTNSNAYKVISKLAPLRKSNPALAYGTSQQRWLNNDIYIYERQFGSNVVLTAVNRNQSASANITGLYTSLPAGTYSDVLQGALGGSSITVSGAGNVTSFTLAAGGSAVWQYQTGAFSTPKIGNINPMMGKSGNIVTIDGRGFGSATGQVKFGTTAAIVQSWNDTEIKVQIPNAAAGRYGVTVINSNGTQSNTYENFEILSAAQVSVRFKVNNANTKYGTNVYLVGSVYELGNWNTASAIGPLFNSTSTIGTYPTWFYDISVPAGTRVNYKFIKKDSAGNVVWEGGNNHFVDTPSSGTAMVAVDWKN